MNNCNCNQGRHPCTCDKSGTVERSPAIAIAALVIVALYLGAHWLIGG